MELNIQAIADAKIREMHESGKIKERIEKDVEDTILKAIDSAINGYELRRELEKKVSESVSSIASEIGFSAYNGFIASAIRRITEDVMREDVEQKIQKTIDELLIVRHDGIKLSQIFEAYRKWVCEAVEEAEKYERGHFLCELEIKEDGSFTRYKVRFHEEEPDKFEQPQIDFRMMSYETDRTSTISALYLDGKNVNGKYKLGTLTEVEALLANLYFNGTKIILDTEDVDDSDGFDIDI